MTTFTRDDRRTLRVVDGFRRLLLDSRPPTTPRAGWTAEQYAAAAAKKRSRAARLVESFRRWHGTLDGATILDVACGDGSNCLALDEQRARIVVGIDLDIPMFGPGERGEQTRTLAAYFSRAAASRPRGRARFARMDATSLGFVDGAFDILMSRSATEHIRPIEDALREMVRVVRHGGLIYLGIDPYFWVRGCHKRGVVDIPWAHARLTLAEYRRFVTAHEGEPLAAERCRRLETLNRLTVSDWRRLVDGMDCQVLEWKQRRSTLGEQLLARHPDVLETLLPGLMPDDLLSERIEVWMRKVGRGRQ